MQLRVGHARVLCESFARQRVPFYAAAALGERGGSGCTAAVRCSIPTPLPPCTPGLLSKTAKPAAPCLHAANIEMMMGYYWSISGAARCAALCPPSGWDSLLAELALPRARLASSNTPVLAFVSTCGSAVLIQQTCPPPPEFSLHSRRWRVRHPSTWVHAKLQTRGQPARKPHLAVRDCPQGPCTV